MGNKATMLNQIIEDSKKFGCYERLTPHIYVSFKDTARYLSILKTDIVLDIGAGDKKYKNYVNCRKYISLDVSGKVDVIADATALPFKNYSFDMIMCTQVMEHIKNPFLAMEEFSRVLKESGIIFITVPTVMYLHETPSDYFRYTKYGIEYLLNKNNISIQKSEVICSGFLVGLNLFFIGAYYGIYKVIKSQFVKRLLVSKISYLSIIAAKMDNSRVMTIFPGDILVIAIKGKNKGIL
jgi:SAM-dependent methyltransferase